MSKRGIPDRWIPYSNCGSIIEGTNIICFKVPIKKTLQVGKREIKEIWDIKALLKKIPGLGAVIDLTNTARYYDPAELRAAGVLHKKILMPGRQIPPDNKVTEFMKCCDEFLAMRKDMILGVHCTHGLNRTGYMVCRYMRDRMNIPAQEAIEKFEKARGYHIERQNYIADLLGQTPHPPDVGSHTAVRPIEESWRSRHNSERSSNDGENSNIDYRHLSSRNGIKRRRYSSGNSSRERLKNYSYDYKYDY